MNYRLKKICRTIVAISMLMNVSALSAETLTALNIEEGSYNVAQVTDHKDIGTNDFSAQIVSVYRGGVAQPFGVLLTVWDLEPQEGGDFGTFSTFDLGNYASTPSNVKISYGAKNNNAALDVFLDLATWNPDTNETKVERFKLEIKIKDGVVVSKATLNLASK